MTQRALCAAFGWAAVAFATVGLFVPGRPAMVFVLVASYSFSKSSPRFARWLHGHRWLSPIARRWGPHGPRTATTGTQ